MGEDPERGSGRVTHESLGRVWGCRRPFLSSGSPGKGIGAAGTVAPGQGTYFARQATERCKRRSEF